LGGDAVRRGWLTPFATLPSLDSLIAVQMILAVVAMPLMCIAAAISSQEPPIRHRHLGRG
jgi:hypothetical protein